MQENFRSNKIKKVSAVLLVVLFCACVFGSFLCAIVLPFRKDVACAASDASIASASSDAPTYADGVIAGTYIDFSVYKAVPLSAINNYTRYYGFFYDVSVAPRSLSQEYTLRLEDYSDSQTFFYKNPRLVFSNSSVYFACASNSNSTVQKYPLMSSNLVSGNLKYTYAVNGVVFNKGVSFDDSDFQFIESGDLHDYFSGYWYAITSLPGSYESEGFTNRFVTAYDYASQSVYFNLSVTPSLPSSGFYSDGGRSSYVYDYFSYGVALLSSPSVRWTVRSASTANTYNAYLTIGAYSPRADKIYSCVLTGSSFTEALTSTPTDGKWYVSGNMSDTQNMVYKYQLTNQDRYFALFNNENNKTVLDNHYSGDMWGSWLALVDIQNMPFLDNNLTFNAGFDSGYQSGLTDGAKQGDAEGYNRGYTDGKVNGYNEGYNAGKDVSGNYTFLGLIGAVIDAPIEAFNGLFDFEILGVDMSSFVLSLLTLSVVIIVIRMALGGK